MLRSLLFLSIVASLSWSLISCSMRSEFTALQNRVTALEERQIADWSRIVSSLQPSVYAVIAMAYNESYSEDNDIFVFAGTGFLGL